MKDPNGVETYEFIFFLLETDASRYVVEEGRCRSERNLLQTNSKLSPNDGQREISKLLGMALYETLRAITPSADVSHPRRERRRGSN